MDTWSRLTMDEAATGGKAFTSEDWDVICDTANDTDIIMRSCASSRERFMLIDEGLVELGEGDDHLRRACEAMAAILSLHPDILFATTRKMTDDPKNPWRVDVVREAPDHALKVTVSYSGGDIVRFSRSLSGMMSHVSVTPGAEAQAAMVMSRMTVRTITLRDEAIAAAEEAEDEDEE